MEQFRERPDGRREHLVCPIEKQTAAALAGIDDLLLVEKIRPRKPRS